MTQPTQANQTAHDMRRNRWQGIAYVACAALMWSTAGIWVRYLSLDIWTIQPAALFAVRCRCLSIC